jgi:hypothetical protein
LNESENQLIVFDIDDTALLSEQTIKMLYPKFNFRIYSPIYPANPVILELYKFLCEKGFKIIFLSARTNFHSTCGSEVAILNLILAGYDKFDAVLLIPEADCNAFLENNDYYDFPAYAALWKSNMKTLLEHGGYHIIGCFDDQIKNLALCNNGRHLERGNYKIPTAEEVYYSLYGPQMHFIGEF